MRMRHKPNLQPRLEECASVIIKNPADLKGKWMKEFSGYREVRLEIGCGKGRFTVNTAAADPDVLLVALEKVPDAMVTAAERAMEQSSTNIRFIIGDAADIPSMFDKGELSRIYINFCDPWPKSRDAKNRLTAPAFLRRYADALQINGEIHFKTDNTPLFDWSAAQFETEGWLVKDLTHDLHANGPVGVMTDYEAKFYQQGMKINRLAAIKNVLTKGTAAGEVPRLKNASLVDARGYETSKRDNGEKES